MEEKSCDNENQCEKQVDSVTSDVISPSSTQLSKTNTERQREYRLRKKRKKFLKKELNLDFVSGNTLGTTRYGTTIDGIFSTYVNHITSDVHVSYFSYHKPIVTVINNDIAVNEISNVQDDLNIEE
ncbi:hypothetical protein PV327_011433 [Microctonus hyperodae]|uniref:Uncharacterized protein n=1 Tax=Microctonus hyperodae TaxID=165561 RepID=A0AA39C438_MICHY|nr:hypothetical protein PV327_011433 [Microctonus hyperodae]